ncbi:RNA polymerase subunit alpha domain protein [Planctomycetales bacterium]|nr:RNA polymerase subunit alpha domain protein [Planctomycetales bacterium]GHT03522.1 RNA polymerase subunit alpha domain protein [Planctomycetales bacterium]GHV19725.1 RNA polymerase subunit alpha domain protein [Planctomycetales bacterium]
MENLKNSVDLAAVLLSDEMDIEKVLRAAHLARQFHNVYLQAKRDFDGVKNAVKNPKDARLAAGYWIIGNLDEAAAHAQNDKTGVGQIILGLIAENDGNYAAALVCYDQAAPAYRFADLLKVGILRRLGKLDEANKAVAKLERELGDQAELHYQKGRCLEAAGKIGAALAAFDQALTYAPQHAESLFHAGRLLDLRGDESTAIKYYEKIGPAAGETYTNALLNLATLYEDLNRANDAMQCCQMLLRQNPTNKRARLIVDSISAAAGMYYSPEETKQSEKLEAILRVPVTDFELSVRSRNCLAKMNIRTLGDLVKRTENELLAYKNFGETSLREIRDILNSRNLRLGMLREDAATRAAYNRSQVRQHDELLAKTIDFLELSVRSRKCMDRLGIRTVGQLCDKTETSLENAKNFGRVSLNEIKKRLQEFNLSLRPED